MRMSGDSSQWTSSQLVLPSNIPTRSTSESGQDVSTQQMTMSYYIHSFVPSISVASTSTSFYTALYIPMALHTRGLLDALLACASLHQARRAQTLEDEEQLLDLSNKYQLCCLGYLRERINQGGDLREDAYGIVAITILLAGIESINGNNSTKWRKQIASARNLLSRMCIGNSSKSWEVESLIRHLNYHDTMSSLMVGIGEPDPIAFDQHSPLAIGSESETSNYIDPLMGISQDIFALIRRIQYLPRPISLSDPEYLMLEHEISQWKHADLASLQIDLGTALELTVLAEANRLAALILLYRRADQLHPMLPSLASQTMSLIRCIPKASMTEAGFNLPLFVAGAELESEDEIEECLVRLFAMRDKFKFENITNMILVLEEVWRARLNEERKRDWEDVLRSWGWTISLS
ncbi:MAG: hypothetical protein M1820_005708 [Bogoriella megaspora]|nr:MAG: hypothetical protein M1820_005708 [Bogoriella megaspora]